ncbi:MAG: DUF6197 family protein [Actinoallomurus sp.]
MNALLIGAAVIMQRNGWIQDDYFDADLYQPDVPCRVCPRAAIAIAAGQHPMFVASWPLRCAAPEPDEAECATYNEIKAAEGLLARYLREELRYNDGGSLDGDMVEVWADEEQRTLPEILGVLHAAAEHSGRSA